MRFSWIAFVGACLLAQSASAQRLVASSERTLAPPGFGPAPWEDYSPIAVRGDGQSLLLWYQGANSYGGQVAGRILGDDGSVIELPPIVASPRTYQYALAAAFDGTRYLVTFAHTIPSGGGSAQIQYLGIFVSSAGQLGAPFPIVDDPDLGLGASLAYANGVFLFVYSILDLNWVTDGAIIDSAGGVTPVARLAPRSGAYPRVASDGVGFLVTWEDFASDTIAFRRFDSAGAPVGAIRWPQREGSVDWTSDHRPALAFAGDQYFLGFESRTFDGAEWGPYYVRIVRIAASDGAIRDAPAIDVATAAYAWHPRLASVGPDVVALWGTNCCGWGGIAGARIDANGEVLDPGGVVLEPDPFADASYGTAGLATPTGFTMYYAAPNAGTYILHNREVWARRIAAPFVPGERELVSGIATPQYWPRLDVGASQSLLVWQDQRTMRSQLYATRIDPSGAALDGSGIALRSAEVEQTRAAHARAESSTLIVWSEEARLPEQDYSIRGALVTNDGGALEPMPIELVPGSPGFANTPAVATNGQDYLVVWVTQIDGTLRLYGTFISSSGQVATPGGRPILDVPIIGAFPVLARTPEGYLLLFVSRTAGVDHVYAMTLDDNASPTRAEPLRLGRGNAGALTVVGSKAFALVNDNGARLTLLELERSPLSITRELLIDQGQLGWLPSIAALADGSLVVAWSAWAADYSVLVRATALCAGGAAPASPITLATVGNNYHQSSVFLAPSGATAELVYSGGAARTTALARAITLSVDGCAPPIDADAGMPADDGGASAADGGSDFIDGGLDAGRIDAALARSDGSRVDADAPAGGVSGGACGCRGVAHDRSRLEAFAMSFVVLLVVRARASRGRRATRAHRA